MPTDRATLLELAVRDIALDFSPTEIKRETMSVQRAWKLGRLREDEHTPSIDPDLRRPLFAILALMVEECDLVLDGLPVHQHDAGLAIELVGKAFGNAAARIDPRHEFTPERKGEHDE